MKNLILASITVVLVFTSCNQDEDGMVDAREPAGEISFYATAPKGSRAASTTTATLKNFVVYAFTNSSVLMDGVTVSKSGGSWTYSPVVHWPATPVNFYAVSPDIRNGVISMPDADNVIRNIRYGGTDILYAVSLNRHESPSPVDMTFRHAMSRVAVLLSSTNVKYDVEVFHVSLKNISLSGDFALPNDDTSDDATVGIWDALSAPSDALLYYDSGGGVYSLGTTPTDLTDGNLEASFFVPQHLQELDYSASAGFSGSYMQIDCVIKDKFTGEKIWPTDHTPDYLLVPHTESGRMVFPLATPAVDSWQQGFSYIYNVIINNTYTLDNIEFSPVVKNYVDVVPY